MLETNDDDDDDVEPSNQHNPSSSDGQSASTESPFDYIRVEDLPCIDLPPQTMRRLLSIYSCNVDQVMKVVHFPTLRRCIEDGGMYLGYSVESHAFGALRSAFSYISVVSLDARKCLDYLGEHKAKLVERWQSHTEIWLRKADMVNNHNIVVLQAMILYAVCINLSAHQLPI